MFFGGNCSHTLSVVAPKCAMSGCRSFTKAGGTLLKEHTLKGSDRIGHEDRRT